MKKTLLSLAMFSALGMSALAHAADITVAYAADPVSMDPMEQLSSGTLQMANMVYDPLVRADHNMKIQPRLATSWKQISPTVVEFKLRQGVKFHNGDPMTADDVVFSFDRLKKSMDFKGLYEPYEGMKKIDDYTVQLIMKKPYPLWLQNMTYVFVMDHKFFAGDKGIIKKSAGTFASMHEDGTGAFELVSRQQGVKSVYKKFADYWGDTGNVDQLTLVPIKEDNTRTSALLSGDVDAAYPIAPTDIKRVENSGKTKVNSIASDRIILLEMNQKVVPQFQDKRVREAVVYAVNNAGIVAKIMRGNATAAAQLSPEGYVAHNPDLKPRYDLQKAQALMKEAGQEKGFTITMISPNNRYVNDQKIAEAVAAMLAKINIKVDLTTMPKAQFWDEFDKCAAGMSLIGWSSDTGDSANFSQYITATKNNDTGLGQYNCGGYSNAELDSTLAAADTELDPAKRKADLLKVTQIEHDDALIVPLHWQNLNWGYTKSFENFPTIVNLRNFPHWDLLKVKED